MAGQGGPGASSRGPQARSGGGRLDWLEARPGDPAHRALESTGDLTELVGDPSVEEVRLPSRAESASIARRLTHSVLHGHWKLPLEFTEDAVLLVSELVGNAVRHTGAQVFGLRIPRARGCVRVEVRDPSRALPCLLPVDVRDISGRGLFLVNELSDRWGVDLQPRGKTTWFEMRLPER